MPIRLSVFVIIAAVLAACAAPPPAPPQAVATAIPSTATAAPPEPTATPRPPTPTAIPPSPTPEPVGLTIWVAEDEPAFAAIAAELQAAAQEVDITIRVLARAPDGLRLSLATSAVLGEAPPDLIWGDRNALVGLLADGVLQPLPAAVSRGVVPALETTVRAERRIWAAPMLTHGGLLMFTNPALIENPPTTSDELIVRSRAASSSEVAGLVMGWYEPQWLTPWYYAFGGSLTDAQGDLPTLENQAMIDALNLLRELYVAAPKNGDGYQRAQRLLAQGYAAIAIDGDWSLTQYRTLSETLSLQFSPLPTVPATGSRALPLLDGDLLMLHRNADDARSAAALQLIAAMQQPARQAVLALSLERLPAMLAALDAPELAADPLLATQLPLLRRAPGLPPTTAARCALVGIDVWLPSLIDGSVAVDELATRMQREAEACNNQ